ncbi:MAG: hypothetical protein Q9227_001168 [Pyrenula ochraceoflavens]
MQKMARRAAERLASPSDQPQKSYFDRIFTEPNDPRYREYLETVKGTLGGIAGLEPISDNDRIRANFRFYCDNDALRSDETEDARWSVRDDPPESERPTGYVLQRDRLIRSSPRRLEDEAWQEYQDNENEMLANETGCRLRDVLAATYLIPKHEPLTSQPTVRATVTLCDHGYIQRYATLMAAISGRDLSELPNGDDPALSRLDIFRNIMSMTLLHELQATHLPPPKRKPSLRRVAQQKSLDYLKTTRIIIESCSSSFFSTLSVTPCLLTVQCSDEDVPAPQRIGPHGEFEPLDYRAYGWWNVLSLPPADSVRNVDNYMYFALLCRLADRGWRLGEDWWKGDLVRDPSLVLPFVDKRDV